MKLLIVLCFPILANAGMSKGSGQSEIDKIMEPAREQIAKLAEERRANLIDNLCGTFNLALGDTWADCIKKYEFLKARDISVIPVHICKGIKDYSDKNRCYEKAGEGLQQYNQIKVLTDACLKLKIQNERAQCNDDAFFEGMLKVAPQREIENLDANKGKGNTGF